MTILQEELELIHKAAEGDAHAFETLLLAYQKQVYNLALRMTGNPDRCHGPLTGGVYQGLAGAFVLSF